MSYRFQADEALADGVPRVACEQVDRALAELNGQDTDTAEAVHQVRKRCKKIRGLLRLVRGSFSASYQQSGVHEGAESAEQIAETVADLRDARIHVLGWRLNDEGFAALEQGLRRTYRRARKAQRISYRTPTPEQFHEWRKRVKYHWYHLRLLRELWPVPMKGFAAQAGQLADLLGDDHDLAVLQETLRQDKEASGDPGQLETLAGLAQRRQDQLRAEAWALGWRLFADKPRHFCRRLHRYWQAAQRDAARAAGCIGPGC